MEAWYVKSIRSSRLIKKLTTLSSNLICLERPENKAGTTDGGLKLEVYMTSAPIWLNPQNPAIGRFRAYANAKPHSLARRSTIAINWKRFLPC